MIAIRDARSRAARLGSYVVLLALGYYLAARLGLGFRFQNSQIGVVWPANAVLLAALLLTRTTRWWVVLVVTALAHAVAVASVTPAWRAAWQIAGNALFTTSTALVLRRVPGLPLTFETRRQVFAYSAIAFVLPALYAFTTPAFVRGLFNLEVAPGATLATTLLRVTLSNATALLLVAPVVLLWAQLPVHRLKELSARRLWEAGAVLLSVLAVGMVAFGTGPEIAAGVPLLWVFPPLLWVAVRFGPVGASTALLGVAALSVWGTARQLGPFVLMTESDRVLSLQLFWIVMCTPVMLLAAVIWERERVEDALQAHRNQLAHLTRVATAGELSSSLAHELRQPLTAILANAEAARALLTRDGVDLQEVRAMLEDIAEQDKFAANVIGRLRSLLEKEEPHFEMLEIETTVRDALALSRGTVERSGVQVETQIAPGLPRVRGDPVQLLQVVLNLVVNGCESMSATPAPDRRLRLRVARQDSKYVEVLITDSGAGLPKGREDRVFEPFFTTKTNGLGLGLAIGRSIVSAHGGRLWGENNLLRGATFHLLVPMDHGNDGQTAADRHSR